MTAIGSSLFEKIWSSHVVKALGEGRAVIHIDRHILQDDSCRLAFDALRKMKLPVRDRELTFGVTDHGVSTIPGRTADSYQPTRYRIIAMRDNCREMGIQLFDLDDPRQGITHVIAPEQGITLPGCTVVCADSHTATNGGLGAWSWGIGTSEVRHVLANQTLIQRKPKTMRIMFEGALAPGIYAKDIILYLIGRYGITAGTGFAVEYAGPAIRALPVEGRLTLCNMSIELGARSGMIGVDDSTIEYLAGRPYVPKGALWDRAVGDWRKMHTDADAIFDSQLKINCSGIKPQVTWGTTPQDVLGIDGYVPDPDAAENAERRNSILQALNYIGLTPGQALDGIPIDIAFIGSCTNSRLSDLEAAASILRGRKVAEGVRALCVPGSTMIKRAAEAKGLDRVFREAGFEWRESGCSMCTGTNGDAVGPGMRSLSTSNRNFENRQGTGSRTHLASPAMVAAAAVTGHITDVRKLMGERP